MADVDTTRLIDKTLQIVNDAQIGLAAEITYHIQSFEFVRNDGRLVKYELSVSLAVPEINREFKPYSRKDRQKWRAKKMVYRLRGGGGRSCCSIT